MITKLTALKNHVGFIRYFTNICWMMGEQYKQMAVCVLGRDASTIKVSFK